MKKNFTALSLAYAMLLSSTAVQAESFSAKRVGQGFTSVTKDFTSAISNPALLNRHDSDDDFAFSLNIGAAISDEYDVIDIGEKIAQDIETLDQNIDQIDNVPPILLPGYIAELEEQVDTIAADLLIIDDKPVQSRLGLNGFIAIPNKWFNFAFFADSFGRIAARVDYAPEDKDTLLDSIAAGDLDLNDLNSDATGVGYVVSDAGLMFAYNVFDTETLKVSYGAKLKFQRIDLFYNNISVADFDEDQFDLTDDQFLTDESEANLDLGLHASWGDNQQWHFGLAANNLLGRDVDFSEQDLTFELKPSFIAGISYENSWVTISAESDLTERETFEQLEPSQYVSTGVEFKAGEHAQLRFGYRTDIKDTEVDVYTVGLGLSPWDIISIDIGAFKGEGDLVGGALQLGFKI